MIKTVVLGSGSKGNAIWLEIDGNQFLVDCGFTKIQTKKRLALIGRQIEDIKTVFITHDHGDHKAPWLEKENMIAGCLLPGMAKFKLSHDSESYGYTIQDKDGNKVAILMDTGCVPEEIIPHLFDCSVIMIETNYDIDMLVNSPYPTELQERISSSVGHLRDQCAAEVVEMVAWPGLQYVVAMHLSSTCINPVLARFELESVLDGCHGCQVVVSDQKKPTSMIVVM